MSEFSRATEVELEHALGSLGTNVGVATIGTLARLLADGLRGESPIAEAGSEVESLLRQLQGQTVRSTGAAIRFGSGSTFGDVTIEGDVAGNDIIKVSIEFPETAYSVGGRPNPYLG